MNTLQTWLIIGIPGLVVVAALFSGHSRVRTQLGYLGLTALLVTFVIVTGEVFWSAAVGLVGFFLVASGRGTADEDAPDEHENRRRYTTTPSQG